MVPPYQQAVGGISIRSDSLIENASVADIAKVKAGWAKLIKDAPTNINAPASLRKVSLRGLEQAIADSLKAGKPLPDEVLFLAGLQDIRYVFVYPEQKDIVLAGFGEGWRVDDHGNVVGVTTGKPVLLLDDLLTALRTAESSARTGISCSIDPTLKASGNMRAYVSSLRTMNNQQAITAGRRRPWAGKMSPLRACRPRATLPPCCWRPTIA